MIHIERDYQDNNPIACKTWEHAKKVLQGLDYSSINYVGVYGDDGEDMFGCYMMPQQSEGVAGNLESNLKVFLCAKECIGMSWGEAFVTDLDSVIEGHQ